MIFSQNTEEDRPHLVGVPHQAPPPNNQQVHPEQPLLPGIEGAVGGAREGFALENAVQQLTTSLRGLLEQLQLRTADNEEQGNEEEDDDESD